MIETAHVKHFPHGAPRSKAYAEIYAATDKLLDLPEDQCVKVTLGKVKPAIAQKKAHVSFRRIAGWRLCTRYHEGKLWLMKEKLHERPAVLKSGDMR